MAIGVDTSKWKPRSIQGTPANRFRNILGASLLAFGLISGAIFHFSSVTTGLRKAAEKLYEDPIAEVERRRMIAAGLPTRTGDSLRKQIEENERLDRPDK